MYELDDVLIKNGCTFVDPDVPYRDMWHIGENVIQRKGESHNLKWNPVAWGTKSVDDEGRPLRVALLDKQGCQVYAEKSVIRKDEFGNEIKDTKKIPLTKIKNKVDELFFDNDFTRKLAYLRELPFAVTNGVGIGGKAVKGKMTAKAKVAFALIFDLDDVTTQTLNNLFIQCNISDSGYHLPHPNYIVLSGGGIHLYYIFNRPIDIHTKRKKNELQEIKKIIAGRIWNERTTTKRGSDGKLTKPEAIDLVHEFRVIGGKCKPNRPRKTADAYSYRKEFYSLDELKTYASVDLEDFDVYWAKKNKFKHTLDEWKILDPNWYERRIIKHEKPRHWSFNSDAPYRKFIERIYNDVQIGHRYFCVKCLAAIALQCNVSYDKLIADAEKLLPRLQSFDTSANKFDYNNDFLQALNWYFDSHAWETRVEYVRNSTGVDLPITKRNYRKQTDHLKIARNTIKGYIEAGEIEHNPGRKPTQFNKAFDYLKSINADTIRYEKVFDKHVNPTKISKATGVSRAVAYEAIKKIKISKGWIYDEAEANQHSDAIRDTYEKFVEYVKKNNLESVVNIDNLTEKQVQDLYAIVAKVM